MENENLFMLKTRRIINGDDLDAYLTMLDYETCNDVERWCANNSPTAKIHRTIKPDDLYIIITWYIKFQNKEDLTLFQLTR